MNAIEIYLGSNGDVTTAYYAELAKRGPIGWIAVNLFRAQKASVRAKVYRGKPRPGDRSYSRMAYDKKNWSMENLSKILTEHAAQFGIIWGWKQDTKAVAFEWVMYVDLPGIGQVSFHSAGRKAGPDYPGEWDGQKKSAERVIAFCDRVFKGEACESSAANAESSLTTLTGQQGALIES